MLLIVSLVLFFLLHLIPFSPKLRTQLITKLGPKRYKLFFRLCAISIILLLVQGWDAFPNHYFYEPSLILKQVHITLMLPIVFLLVIAEIPNNFKRFIPHPMLTGVQIGTLSHLLANGDLRSMILFISFFLFASWARWKSNRREVQPVHPETSARADIKTGAIAAAVYLFILLMHGVFFGMPVYQYVL